MLPRPRSRRRRPFRHQQATPSRLCLLTCLGAAGESSLAAHSAFASDFVHQVASAVPTQASGPEIRDTLDALSHVVISLREQTVASAMSYPHARPNLRLGPSHAGHELPPIKKAVKLIGMAKSKQLNLKALWCYGVMI